MKYTFVTLFVFASCIVPTVVSAQMADPEWVDSSVTEQSIEAQRAFEQVSQPVLPGVLVPTVVEYNVPNTVSLQNMAVFDSASERFVYSYTDQSINTVTIPVSVTANGSPAFSRLTDGRSETTMDFQLPEAARGEVELRYDATSAVTTNALYVQFAPYVTKPSTVSVYAEVNGSWQTVLAPVSWRYGSQITFPETTARSWRVIMTYTQPLRIAEMNFVQNDSARATYRTVRFLAQPQRLYEIYAEPDRSPNIRVSETTNLRTDDGVLRIGEILSFAPNTGYVPADSDKDGVIDELDNCPQVANEDQADIDGSGTGDACEDFDRDGHMNNVDNCPDDPNRSQADQDGDGVGDVCDEEESRLTEKYAWVPWVGMGFAALVLITMFLIVARSKPLEPEVAEADTPPESHV